MAEGPEHGVYVDPKGFVWIGGSGPKDNQVLKFTKSGKFVMNIGCAGHSKGNADTENLNQPADTFVYSKTYELSVAYGYGNRRVIVFDADSGKFKRMWGASGMSPRTARRNPASADADPNGATQFVQPVHAARVSNHGLVEPHPYLGGKRIQVFTIFMASSSIRCLSAVIARRQNVATGKPLRYRVLDGR